MSLTGRIRMNTETLKRTFPEVYQEFFSKCSTVVSAPGSFFWSAGLAVIYGGIGVLEKIPLRVYVGIERDNQKNLRFGDCIAYIPHQQQFERFYPDKIYEERFIKLINELRKGLPQPPSGKIHILSEVPRGAGLNQSGTINMALSVLLGIESSLVTQDKITELVNAKTPDLQQNPIFDKLLRLAWKLEAPAHADIGSGSAPFAAFIDSVSPLIFFSERRQGTYSNHPYARYPSDVEGHYEVFDTIEYAGYRLKDLFDWRSDPSWPVDYGLIYLGQQKHSSIFLRPMKTVKATLDRLEDFIVTYLKQFPSKSRDVDPAFYFMTQANEHRGFWEKSLNFLIILSVKAIWELKTLLENGTAEALEEFCDTVNLQEKVMKFFIRGVGSSNEVSLLNRIQETVSGKSSNGLRTVKFLPDRADSGGDLLFVAPQGYLQDHMEEFQILLRTQVSPLARIDYMSWVDGMETGGVRIEQNLAENYFSPFVGIGTFHITEWRTEGTPVSKIYSPEAFEKNRLTIDLLLDENEHKISIRGEPLTSKDIKSTKATIDIMKVLLSHLGKEVRATDLPPSTYVERNEMQSKIISPLTSSFRRLTGKRLPLSLHGGLRKNFSMKLDRANIVIGLLEKSQ